MKTLVLFDIDGTLITCGKTPRRSITRAMEEIFGTRGGVDAYPFSGKTDTQIVYDVMTGANFASGDVQERMQSALRRYAELLDADLKPDEIHVLDGVVALLDELNSHSGAVLGLLTGNILEGARIKLGRAGLDHYFFNGAPVIGAFGSDSMHRHELASLAVRRAGDITGLAFNGKSIVIVGDSPYDILCGKHLNAKSVAVTTGWHSAQELKEHDPDHLLPGFGDTEAALHCLFN